MKLAHQTAPTPGVDREVSTKKYVDDTVGAVDSGEYQVLFTWNHADITQFTLTDPAIDGWGFAFVAATTGKAEYIRITAPTVGTDSVAYLTVTGGLPSAEIEMNVTHGFFNTNNQQLVTALVRGANIVTDIYAGATWDQPSGTLEAVYNEGAGEIAAASTLELVPSGIDATNGHTTRVETWVTARGLLIGKGWGRFASYGHIDTTTEAGLGTSLNAGLRFDKKTASAGETLEIFDLVIYQRRP
jgi:hypothetical protein